MTTEIKISSWEESNYTTSQNRINEATLHYQNFIYANISSLLYDIQPPRTTRLSQSVKLAPAGLPSALTWKTVSGNVMDGFDSDDAACVGDWCWSWNEHLFMPPPLIHTDTHIPHTLTTCWTCGAQVSHLR